MSDEELKKTLEGMERLRKELTSSPEKALKFVVDNGFVKPNGELTDEYKPGA